MIFLIFNEPFQYSIHTLVLYHSYMHHFRHRYSQQCFCHRAVLTRQTVLVIDVLCDRRQLGYGAAIVYAQKIGIGRVLLSDLCS